MSEAVDEAQAALDWLRRAGAQRFFWKYCSTFDSTPRGNIGPVAEALMKALDTDQTIYCPAFPENGRSIFMGNLFVGEQPLAESPMKDHPLTPMTGFEPPAPLGASGDIAGRACQPAYCGQGYAGAPRQTWRSCEPDGVAHVIIDAVANDDLYIIAEACQDMTLLTGGSAIAMPLPEIWIRQGLVDRSRRHQATMPKTGLP